MKKYLLVLVLLSSVLSAPAAPASDQSIEKMMGVMHVQAMLDQMIKQMDDGIRGAMRQGLAQAMKGKEPSAAQKTKITEFQNKLSQMMKDELSYAKMKDVYLQVYRETFTQEEISSIIAFYSSPAGKAMIEKIPVAMQKASTLVQGRIGPMTEKIQGLMADFEKELEKTE